MRWFARSASLIVALSLSASPSQAAPVQTGVMTVSPGQTARLNVTNLLPSDRDPRVSACAVSMAFLDETGTPLMTRSGHPVAIEASVLPGQSAFVELPRALAAGGLFRAVLTHTWAVTVTGAPKTWAMQFIEDHERSPRAWYGGAIGLIGFDGNLNTGLTLRTIRIKNGVAELRVGATLLFDSDPDEEERETHVKASAFIDAIRRPREATPPTAASATQPGRGMRILLVDHQDSFVHTLANYFRQTGAEVITLRAGFDPTELDRVQPHLVVLSPGPGTPQDFDVSGTLDAVLSRSLPAFGVCLGLQGMVVHFGGKLGVLDYPMHGKSSQIRILGGRIFEGLPREITAARYHSLYALREQMPPTLHVTAESPDGVVMAIEHAELPLAAVQFHPESILTLEDDVGLRLIRNVVTALSRRA